MIYLVAIISPESGEPLVTHTTAESEVDIALLSPLFETLKIYAKGLKNEIRTITFQDKYVHVFSDTVIVAIMTDIWDDEIQVHPIVSEIYSEFFNKYRTRLTQKYKLKAEYFEDFNKNIEKYIIRYEHSQREKIIGQPQIYLSHRLSKNEPRVNEDIIISFYVYNNESTAIILKRIDEICGIASLQPIWTSQGFCTGSYLHFESVYVKPGEIAEIQLKLVARRRDIIKFIPVLVYVFNGETKKQSFNEIKIKII